MKKRKAILSLLNSFIMMELHVIQSVHRALALLEHLDRVGAGGLGLTELARMTGLKAPTARNLLSTLVELGYVSQSEANRRYRLGDAARDLGQPQSLCARLRHAAASALATFRDQMNETVLLTLYEDGRRRTLASFESEQPLRVGANIGSDRCFYDTATGRMLLALLSRPERDRLVRALGPVALGWDGVSDRTELERALSAVQASGLAVLEKADSHITALAVPLETSPGGPISALGVYYPSVRDSGGRRQELASRLKDVAKQVTEAYENG